MTLDLQRYKGGAGSPGDVRHFVNGAALPVLDLQGQEWVRAGTLRAYSAGLHSELAALMPGLCVKALPAPAALPSSWAGYAALHRIGSNYLYVNGNQSSSNNWDRVDYGGDLVSWSSANTGDLQGIRGSAVINNRVVVAGVSSGATGLKSFDSSGARTDMSGALQSMRHIASSGALLVAAGSGAATTDAIYTSANGTTVSNTAGSGGGNFTLRGMHWSPAAAAFLYIGATQINKTTNGHAQTACTLPAGVAFPDDDYGLQRYCASSATATLIVLVNGNLLRTTDGVTFTVVNINGAAVQCQIIHDGARFVIAINGGGTARPAFLYSDDDGLTWQMSWAFEDTARAAHSQWINAHMSYVNSKLLVASGSGSDLTPGALYDITGLIGVAPDYVGTMRAHVDVGSSAQNLGLTIYVRTK